MHGGRRFDWWVMRRSPLRFLGSSAPWRAWLYVATGVPFGFLVLATGTATALVGFVLSVVAVGLVALALLGMSGIPRGRGGAPPAAAAR